MTPALNRFSMGAKFVPADALTTAGLAPYSG